MTTRLFGELGQRHKAAATEERKRRSFEAQDKPFAAQGKQAAELES